MPRFTEQQLAAMAATNSEWAAAMHILTTVFAGDGRVWRHVESWGIDFPEIVADGTFSSGEAGLLALAGNLFNGSTDVNLDHLLAVLSDDWFEVALRAILVRRSGR